LPGLAPLRRDAPPGAPQPGQQGGGATGGEADGTAYPEGVLRKYSFALKPGWIALHLFALAAVITMILLGRWQLHVSESRHFNLQNTGYTIQWWVFAGFVCFFWQRILRDAAARRAGSDAEAGATTPEPAAPPDEPVTYRRYVMPTTPEPTDDPALNAYNEYLARLAREEEKK
jgi:DNA-binding transcriptional regulator of glucitol operon